MTAPTKTPAERLAAVLRVVRPDRQWIIYEAGYAWVQEAGDGFTSGYRGEKFRPDSLDDLRRVLLVLSHTQQHRFDIELGKRMTPWAYLTIEPSTILDALHQATGI